MENKGRPLNKFDKIELEIIKEMIDHLDVDDNSNTAQIIKICAHASRRALEKYENINND